MKKIIHIITGLRDGGAEGALYRLVSYDSNMHYVISLTSRGKYYRLLKENGVQVVCLNIKGFFSLIRAIVKLVSILKHENPAVVQTWMYHADLIGGAVARIFSNAKIVWGIRHSDHGDTTRHIRFLAFLSGKVSGWVPDKIVCCSEKAAQYHQEIGYEVGKFIIIPNGYDFDKLKAVSNAREVLLDELDLDSDVFLVGCVARLNEQKDHSNLFSALSKLNYRNLVCILIGNGCEYSNFALLAQLDKFGIRSQVKLLGARTDIPLLMSALDLHVLPSSHGEAFPNVVAEAMACETPCIVTDVGDAAMIVGKYGWVVPPRNSFCLSDKISEAIKLKSSGQLDLVACEAKNSVVERFSIRVMCESFNRAWS
eukprot:gnl/Carplike_NY0171/3983_a5382_248.p1 GENE.gnl/Carplike_NY0171/3983_a5382_248~~gnl/Carplike_NY0171/3983_a5382_248.p1  ORF type:complete len:368 (-),score=17.44 gnl/Carplike_NY0171/3983_a5382_248:1014-2117(-)